MDVNERFDQWLKSLTLQDDLGSTEINEDPSAGKGDKKRNKKKEIKDRNPQNGHSCNKSGSNEIQAHVNDINSNEDNLQQNSELSNQCRSSFGKDTRKFSRIDSNEYEDLNEILKELTSSFESSNSFYGGDHVVQGDTRSSIDISAGIHWNSAGNQSPKFMYKEPNSPNYVYFNPPTLSPGWKKSKFSSVGILKGLQKVLIGALVCCCYTIHVK